MQSVTRCQNLTFNVLSLQIIHVGRRTLFVFSCCYFLCHLLLFFFAVLSGVGVGRGGYAITNRTEQPIHRALWSAVAQWSSRRVAYPCRLISAFVVHEQQNTFLTSWYSSSYTVKRGCAKSTGYGTGSM